MQMMSFKKLVESENLNNEDLEFVELIQREIKEFLSTSSAHCSLVFPPFSDFRRYLLHKVSQIFNLASFSTGIGEVRLTVVCGPLASKQFYEKYLGKPKVSSDSRNLTWFSLGCDPIHIQSPVAKDNTRTSQPYATRQAAAMEISEELPISPPRISTPKVRKVRPTVPLYRPPGARGVKTETPTVKNLPKRNAEPTPSRKIDAQDKPYTRCEPAKGTTDLDSSRIPSLVSSSSQLSRRSSSAKDSDRQSGSMSDSIRSTSTLSAPPNATTTVPGASCLEQKSPSPEQKVLSSEQKAPFPEQKAPSLEQKAPSPEQKAPSLELIAPSLEQIAPSLEQKAPSPEQKAPSLEPEAPATEPATEQEPPTKLFTPFDYTPMPQRLTKRNTPALAPKALAAEQKAPSVEVKEPITLSPLELPTAELINNELTKAGKSNASTNNFEQTDSDISHEIVPEIKPVIIVSLSTKTDAETATLPLELVAEVKVTNEDLLDPLKSHELLHDSPDKASDTIALNNSNLEVENPEQKETEQAANLELYTYPECDTPEKSLQVRELALDMGIKMSHEPVEQQELVREYNFGNDIPVYVLPDIISDKNVAVPDVCNEQEDLLQLTNIPDNGSDHSSSELNSDSTITLNSQGRDGDGDSGYEPSDFELQPEVPVPGVAADSTDLEDIYNLDALTTEEQAVLDAFYADDTNQYLDTWCDVATQTENVAPSSSSGVLVTDKNVPEIISGTDQETGEESNHESVDELKTVYLDNASQTDSPIQNLDDTQEYVCSDTSSMSIHLEHSVSGESNEYYTGLESKDSGNNSSELSYKSDETYISSNAGNALEILIGAQAMLEKHVRSSSPSKTVPEVAAESTKAASPSPKLTNLDEKTIDTLSKIEKLDMAGKIAELGNVFPECSLESVTEYLNQNLVDSASSKSFYPSLEPGHGSNNSTADSQANIGTSSTDSQSAGTSSLRESSFKEEITNIVEEIIQQVVAMNAEEKGTVGEGYLEALNHAMGVEAGVIDVVNDYIKEVYKMAGVAKSESGSDSLKSPSTIDSDHIHHQVALEVMANDFLAEIISVAKSTPNENESTENKVDSIEDAPVKDVTEKHIPIIRTIATEVKKTEKSGSELAWRTKDKDQDEELNKALPVVARRNKRTAKQSYKKADELIISQSELKTKVVKEPATQVRDGAAIDCWEELLNEGALDSEQVAEIKKRVGENVIVTKAKEDYTEFRPKCPLDGDYSHILEIYDFPKEFQTRDLVSIFDSCRIGAYHIKWVDDTHALGVFSSGFAANEVLKMNHPLVRVRSFAEASKQSIARAKRNPHALLPSAVRPQTCPATARRIVTGALGLKVKNAKEERAKEIKILREAREKKKLTEKQQDEAWEGKLPSKE